MWCLDCQCPRAAESSGLATWPPVDIDACLIFHQYTGFFCDVMQHSSIMSVSFYPLWSVINVECDFSCGLCGWRVNVKVIHGEARQLTCDLKYVELCTGVNGEEERKRRSDLWYLHLKLKITTDFQACFGHWMNHHFFEFVNHQWWYSTCVYLVFPPTKALIWRSTGMSFGGMMGTQTQPERFWALGWTTWLSPSKIPSANISTALMMVSKGGQHKEFHLYCGN